eukprot:37897-Chlamydomonas_euryale.AAC.17
MRNPSSATGGGPGLARPPWPLRRRRVAPPAHAASSARSPAGCSPQAAAGPRPAMRSPAAAGRAAGLPACGCGAPTHMREQTRPCPGRCHAPAHSSRGRQRSRRRCTPCRARRPGSQTAQTASAWAALRCFSHPAAGEAPAAAGGSASGRSTAARAPAGRS